MTSIELLAEAAHYTIPLPVYEMVCLGTLQSRNNESFSIYVGLSREFAEQLKQKSLDESDEDLQNNTSDRLRFGLGSYEEWYSKNRTPYALVHEESKALAALVWFGPKPLGRKSMKHLTPEELAQDERLLDAGDWHTIVYRSYNPFRGKGLMKEFAAFAMNEYRKYFPHSKIWAGIFADNPASAGLVKALGFKENAELSSESTKEMILTWEE